MLSSLFSRMVGWPRRWKSASMIAFDCLLLSFAVWASYSLRLGEMFEPTWLQAIMMAAGVAISLPVFVMMGVYRTVIRYLSEDLLIRVGKAMTLSALLWVGLAYMTELQGLEGVPRSIPIIFWLLGIMLVAGSRFFARGLIGATTIQRLKRTPVLIYGAGPAGRQLARVLNTDSSRVPMGMLDDDRALQGTVVEGVRVYHPDFLPSLVSGREVKEIIVCRDEVGIKQTTRLFEEVASTDLKIRVLPPVGDIVGGYHLVSHIREIDIGDLLGRTQVDADPELLGASIRAKCILVTGAGGSIGAELSRQIIDLSPAKVVLLDLSEFALYEIERELRKLGTAAVVPILGSVLDEALVRRVFNEHEIDTVFHAAAYKHVPMVEMNPLAGVANNVIGTWNVARIACEAQVERFVLISTDKAVRPSNVMGASKRWAEIIVQSVGAAGERAQSRFCAVRFGNVLGSNGSVIPLFKEQIRAGGPVTLTDMEMTRYFMSIDEAVTLIIQAGSLAEGGEVFLLEMGAPIRIYDLAANMIRLAGLTVRDESNPSGHIEIRATGIRLGEKMHEELFYDPDSTVRTAHAKILSGERTVRDLDSVTSAVEDLKAAIDAGDLSGLRKLLFSFIRERRETPVAH